MLEVVHITFEKLTGLKGTIEGDFIRVADAGRDSVNRVLVFRGGDLYSVKFSEGDANFEFQFTPQLTIRERMDFYNHFAIGRNFLIKEWSNGGGVRTDVNKNTN